MSKNLLRCSVASALVLIAQSVGAQVTPPPEAPDVGPMVTLTPPEPERPNRIGLNYRIGLNLSVDFKRLGGLALSDPGPLVGTAVNRTYDDGYNRVDIDNNNHGGYIGTWYWGYSSPNSAPGNDTLVLQSYRSPANAVSKDQMDDPQHGFELTYSRELYRGNGWRAGAKAALGYTRISIEDNGTLRNITFRTNDTFALGGVVPPPAGYAGTFAGPGPIIGSQPTLRTTDVLPRSATITGNRQFDDDVFLLRLGPYVEIPLSEKFAAMLDGGLTIGAGAAEFSFKETVTISDPTYGINAMSQTRRGSGSQTDFLVGGYVGGSLSYALSERVNLVVGAQFQAAGEAVNNTKGKRAILDLGKSIVVLVGATYAF